MLATRHCKSKAIILLATLAIAESRRVNQYPRFVTKLDLKSPNKHGGPPLSFFSLAEVSGGVSFVPLGRATGRPAAAVSRPAASRGPRRESLRVASAQHRASRSARVSAVRMCEEGVKESDKAGEEAKIAIAALALVGALETGYITAEKLWGTGAGIERFCASAAGSGCSDVLNSKWAYVGDVPLSLFGFVAYSAISFLAAAPLVGASEPPTDGAAAPAAATAATPAADGALVFGAGALVTFSTYLMLLLAVVIREPCVLCYVSASLTLGLFALAWGGRVVRTRTEAFVYAVSGALVGFAAAATLYAAQTGGAPTLPQTLATPLEGSAPRAPPTVRSTSSARALKIAKRMDARGARFYGAFWCSNCNNQKQLLGKEAMASIAYYECDAEGVGSRRAECRAAGVKGYPTWQLDGALYPGSRSLEELEQMLDGKATPDAFPE